VVCSHLKNKILSNFLKIRCKGKVTASLFITLTEKLGPGVECEKKAHHFTVQLPVPILVWQQ
jgi:hypothetical protein